MGRALLAAARHKKYWTLEEAASYLQVDKATLLRWEQGKSFPQPLHLRKICEVYEATVQDLGLEKGVPAFAMITMHQEIVQEDAYTTVHNQSLSLRLMGLVWNWPNDHYHALQMHINAELAMNGDAITRRDALRLLAGMPVEMYGLSLLTPSAKQPSDELLACCAAGITACWHLRKGKDLAFASDTISRYIPALSVLVKTGSPGQRKSAAELLVQCYLLKSTLVRHVEGNHHASLQYALQADAYSGIAENVLLQVLSLRTQAAVHDYTDNWEQAAKVGLQASRMLETAKSTIPPIVRSFVYAGLANYQAHLGDQEHALQALQKAHAAFYAQSSGDTPPWIDHNETYLYLHDGLVHHYLGLQREAISAFEKIKSLATTTETGRVEAVLDQVMAEVMREDSRDMEYCIDHWVQGIQGAKALQSEQRFSEALQAYTAMRVAWPTEKRVKRLGEYTSHW